MLRDWPDRIPPTEPVERYEDQIARDARFRRREAAKRIIGDACIVGAIVMFAWSMMPG